MEQTAGDGRPVCGAGISWKRFLPAVGSVFARRGVTVAPGGKDAEHLTALGVYFRFGPEGVQKHLGFRILLQGTARKKASGSGNGTSDVGKMSASFRIF